MDLVDSVNGSMSWYMRRIVYCRPYKEAKTYGSGSYAHRRAIGKRLSKYNDPVKATNDLVAVFLHLCALMQLREQASARRLRREGIGLARETPAQNLPSLLL